MPGNLYLHRLEYGWLGAFYNFGTNFDKWRPNVHLYFGEAGNLVIREYLLIYVDGLQQGRPISSGQV